MPQVVRDFSSGETGSVERGRDRLPERVRCHLVEPDARPRFGEVAGGVAGIAEISLGRGEDQGRRYSRANAEPFAQPVKEPTGDLNRSVAGLGLRVVLADQPSLAGSDDVCAERHAADFEVDVLPVERTGFTHSASRSCEELDESDGVQLDESAIRSDGFEKSRDFIQGERNRTPCVSLDVRYLADGVDFHGVRPCRQRHHPRQDATAGLGSAGSMLVNYGLNEAAEALGGRLGDRELADHGSDVELDGLPIGIDSSGSSMGFRRKETIGQIGEPRLSLDLLGGRRLDVKQCELQGVLSGGLRLADPFDLS